MILCNLFGDIPSSLHAPLQRIKYKSRVSYDSYISLKLYMQVCVHILLLLFIDSPTKAMNKIKMTFEDERDS